MPPSGFLRDGKSRMRAVAVAAGVIGGAWARCAAVELSKSPVGYAEDLAQAAEDHKNLVLPAPAGFKPSKVVPTAQLRLIFSKKSYRVGEKIKYRFELQNIGSEPLRFEEQWSFVKSGRFTQDRVRFYATDPEGKESLLISPPRFQRKNADPHLSVELAAGETLRTPGDSDDPDYRTLIVLQKFERPGRYSIRVELNSLSNIPDGAARAEFLVQ